MNAYLEQAKELYRAENNSYCKAMLKVGCLLHEFVVDEIKKGIGLSHEDRIENKVGREWATRDAAKELGIDRHSVLRLMQVYFVVKLLADKGNTGNLPWTSVRHFAKYVRRPLIDTSHATSGDLLQRETWEIVPPEKEKIRIFRQAVAESWTGSQICALVRDRKTRANTSPRSVVDRHADDDEGREEILDENDYLAIAKNASAKDLAELIVRMIEESEDPQQVETEIYNLLAGHAREKEASKNGKTRKRVTA